MPKIYYSFDVIQSLCDNAIKKMQDTDFVPTMIIGVERGGLVPAVYVSHQLSLDFAPFRWSTRDNEKREPISKLTGLIEQGHKLLIVEDIVDTGKTLEEIKTALNANENVRYMTVIQKATADLTADFSGTVVDSDAWIVFPWEAPAYVSNITPRITA